MNLFLTKPITGNDESQGTSLKKCLTSLDLILLGIGAIIGAGVFVLTGVAAATKAGPAVNLSYVLAGMASLFAALSYAELATSVGGCGSAYNYAYASFGELIAWIIGWALILEYTVSVSSVAIGWSGYVNNALQAIHISLPHVLTTNPFEGGWINLPAILIIGVIAFFLCVGVKQSARFNSIIVLVKLITIAVFIGVAFKHVHSENWHPFTPFGWNGIASGAAIVFYAYIGFDAVSTAAEEAVNPKKSLPIGIIGSVVICTLIYVVVATLLTGIVHYSTLNVTSPVAAALLQVGNPIAAGLISIGAIAGLTTVMLVMYYGLTRIILAISRDGLLPPFVARVSPKTHTPIFIIILMGIFIVLIAGFVPLSEAATLVNIGTLAAFTIVCSGVIALRYHKPDLHRPFKLRLNPLIPTLGILLCVYLMLNLPLLTWVWFLSWLGFGLVVYFYYGRKHSVLQGN